MPHFPYSIELHDSRLAEIRREGVTLVLRLSPAYIHRDGKGWSQEAELVVAGGASAAIPDELPNRIFRWSPAHCARAVPQPPHAAIGQRRSRRTRASARIRGGGARYGRGY